MTSIHHRTTQILLALVLVALLAIIAMLATGVRGGPLDPPGSPGSTMQTLDDLPPAWARKLPANNGSAGPNPPAGCDSSRFDCLAAFNNDAVLDRETGLVWYRDASALSDNSWIGAESACRNAFATGRKGWRLPSYEELQTLPDLFTGMPAPLLPVGHPFINVQVDDYYWTDTSTNSTQVWAYRFDNASTTAESKASGINHVWCVRGGKAYNGTP